MPGSLLDFQGPNWMGLVQAGMGLALQMERNRTYEENARSMEERNRLQARSLDQLGAVRGLKFIEDLRGMPEVALALQRDPRKRLQLLRSEAGLYELLTGQTVPLPDDAELLGSLEEAERLTQTLMRRSSPEEQMEAASKLILAAPETGHRIVNDLLKAGQSTAQLQDLQARLELHGAQLKKLNLETARIVDQQTVLTEHLGGIGKLTALERDPKLGTSLRKWMGLGSPAAKEAFLTTHPEFASALKEAMESEKSAIGWVQPDLRVTLQGEEWEPMLVTRLADDLRRKTQELTAAQQLSATGQAPRELEEALHVRSAALRARQAEAQWLENPGDPAAWKALKQAEQYLRTLHDDVARRKGALAQQRDELSLMKFDQATREKLAQGRLQQVYLEQLLAGEPENRAALHASKVIEKEYPGVAFDLNKLVNPEKKGETTFKLQLGQEAQNQRYDRIDAGRALLRQIGKMERIIQEHPDVVGGPAAMEQAAAGAVGQLSNLLGMDARARKFLNTKPRSELEALYQLMVYNLARTLDAKGTLDIKVVEDARAALGNISSFTQDSSQMLEKMRKIRELVKENLRDTKMGLREGPPAYLADEDDYGNIIYPGAASRSGAKDYGSMTDRELLELIVKGAQSGGP